jgi:hypothetical protein
VAGLTPLPTLLTRVLAGIARDAEASGEAPPVLLWSNLLRVVPADGAGLGAAARAACVSRRATAQLVAAGEHAGLVVVDRVGRRSAAVRRTAAGTAAEAAGRESLRRTERAWVQRSGAPVPGLRAGLEAVVGRLDLELAHFPMAYGVADSRITGGRHVAADPGPPPLPAHGREWHPVVRTGPGTALGLPLRALVGQAVTAFAVEYESEAATSLAAAAVLHAIGDDGVPAAGFAPAGFWRGHGELTVEAAAPGRGRVVQVTTPGRAVGDEYARRSADVEDRWRTRFGPGVVDSIRSAAVAIASIVGDGPPHYPLVSWLAGA